MKPRSTMYPVRDAAGKIKVIVYADTQIAAEREALRIIRENPNHFKHLISMGDNNA